LSELRVEKAKILLEQNIKPLKEICDLCGFQSYNYFFRVFKNKTGMTPKDYLKRI
jgi:YesN/AraC family two-component response regulator